ncbi:hypothetical protein Tco_1278566, partial [Tanacetum coccineum]
SVSKSMNYKSEEEKFVLEDDREKKFHQLTNNFAFYENQMDGSLPWKSETAVKLIKPLLKGAVEILDKDGFIDLRLNMGQGWNQWNVGIKI